MAPRGKLASVPRPLFLTGFMATGKSTVGRIVAQRTGTQLVDLDAIIEGVAGRSIAELFRSEGEGTFRRMEREALDRVLASDAAVVALGGGALLDRSTRLKVLDRGVVVTLHAGVDEIVRRSAGGARPLLETADADARREAATRLLETRREAYAEAHAAVSTEGRAPEDVADAVIDVWRRDPIAVAAGARTYCVDVARGCRSLLGERTEGASAILLVSDETVAALHADAVEEHLRTRGHRVARALFPAGEDHKSPATLARVWSAAQDARCDRRSVFVALGGGVVTDIAGFAAATWMRGVRWVGLPTTLLAMVDASVGGKTAVDLGDAKNAVGAFWQPGAVLCDPDLERTEPERGFRSALAEVVKTALIGDGPLLDAIEARHDAILARDPDGIVELVRRSVRVKARIVGADEREDGLRAVLNLGHTVGHALEAHGGYGRLTHGEAVSLGLVAALRIGRSLGVTPPELVERVTTLLARLGLPVDLAAHDVAAASALIGHDKKRSGASIRFVAANAAGAVETVDLPVADVRRLAIASQSG